MVELLEPQDDLIVLEVGTGSGYTAAVLSRLASHVHSVERVAPLARLASERLRLLGYSNVSINIGDGFEGWLAAGPFDRILVTAGVTRLSHTSALRQQLKPGGIMLVPVEREGGGHEVIRLHKGGNSFHSEVTFCATFVPMLRGTTRDDLLA
jgi:protein-L-isoaspartate(D-aspartate) O-methyltransferase